MKVHLLMRAATACALCLIPLVAAGQMVTGRDMPGFAEAFKLPGSVPNASIEVRETAVHAGIAEGANVLWPGEKIKLTLRFTNRTDLPLRASGKVEVIRYGTSVQTGDVWVAHVFRISEHGSVPIKLDLAGKESREIVVEPPIPAMFGGYALIADLGEKGRVFCATLVRVPKPDEGRVQFPTYALDLPWPFEMSEAVATLFERLGVKGCRMGSGYYPTTAPDFEVHMREFYQHLDWASKHQITVMTTIGEGGAPMPLGRPRPWLSDDNVMLDTKSDYAWLPSLDSDFRKWTSMLASRYGWPKGPINAVELWNEPWEGISISGWGADMLRYRDIFTAMAQGVEDARRDSNVKVLIGGACSSTNTRDKLFCDGTDTFLKWLDFVSIHYQPLAADPSLEKRWMSRKSEYGPVRVWDTESWVANSEDRVAAVIASMRAQGQSRTAGIYQGNVYTPEILTDRQRAGIAQAWAPAAAVAASQKFIGQRQFEELLFKYGLPWVFSFKGLKSNDDGTLVVVGDLGGVYDRDRVLFRQVTGLKNIPFVEKARAELNALPADAPEAKRTELTNKLATAQVVQGASLTIPSANGKFVLFDFYGNPLPAKNGMVTVPLNGLGYFMRTDGTAGSFAKLKEAVRKGRVTGYAPVNIVAHDLTAPIESHPNLRLSITNILNRPVGGTLAVSLGNLKLESASRHISIKPNGTSEVVFPVLSGEPSSNNMYPVRATLNAGVDGEAHHEETLRVNVIARKTISVDGDLSDWTNVLPQTVSSDAAMGTSLTEKAYLPFVQFDQSASGGLATGYAAYDKDYFYFAAKAADSTPSDGGVRFATRDDDQYFYPETVYENKEKTKELKWPEGVRRYSYRKDPDLPSGNGTDNVQIAFNVLPAEDKTWLSNPPGLMPGFMCYQDTDYEFAFNQVADQYGGGAEIWRLQAPGIPRKHFYPRQPKSPVDGGPVTDGKLVMKRNGNTRIVEAAIPWSELQDVKRRLDSGQTVKFTFRVNDNKGPALELAARRSVSKTGNPTFHNDWANHWANELEFGWGK